MNIIKQAKSSFGELEIDFYLDKNRNIFVTIEQLAQGFGYKQRRAVEKMIERNSYLRDKKFSIIAEVPYAMGGTQKTRLFNKRGIFEIGMLSKTEKGKIFRQWIYDHIEELEKENANFKIMREIEKSEHRELTQAIKDWEHFNQWSYKAILENALSIGKGRPNYLLFDYLDREQRIFENPDSLAKSSTGNIWHYIRNLIIKDQEERGIL